MTRTDIDTAPLDELIAIRRDQARIDTFRERAAAERTQVDVRVYARVVADYDTRIASLDARARPLLAHAAQEYRALRTLRAEIESAHETAQLAREELRFRHAVGELDEAALSAQAREPEETLARCGEELAALDALKARFIEAAGSEEALTASDAASEPDRAETGHAATEQIAPVESSQTNIFMMDNAPRDASPDSVDTVMSPNTVIGSAALLIDASDDAPADGGARHHLGLTTTVGRSDENSLVLASPGVSRLHAIVEATADGYMLRDLHSQNGTFVNGARVATQPLRDGDEIVFGDARYVFRAFAAGAAAAPLSPPEADKGTDRGRDDS